MLNQLSDIDYLALLERSPLPTPDPDLSQFEGREEWLIVAQHRQELIRLGVNLAGRELDEAIEGYPDNVEAAVIAFLERFQKHNKSATRKLALLIREGVTPVNKRSGKCLGVVEKLIGVKAVVSWAERRDQPNERGTYKLFDLRVLSDDEA